MLGGVGDGYLLASLSGAITNNLNGLRSNVFVVEPDAEVLTNTMMIHDYTGIDGPIECKNYLWFVGADWEQQLREALTTDLFLPDPAGVLNLSLRREHISQRVSDILTQRRQPNGQLVRDIETYYDSLGKEHLVELFGDSPPRPPRVLVLTSRFTTVLQYSARDVANAFEQIGWQTRYLIEPSSYTV